MLDSDFESRLTQALETPPEVRIPADFAVRLAQRAASQTAIARPSRSASRFGPLAIRVSVAVLLVAMLLTARLTAGILPLGLECLLGAEFIALTLWLSLDRKSLT